MKLLLQKLTTFPGLSADENTIYRNFNFLLLFGMLDISIISLPLASITPSWPFWLCVSELIAFALFLILHVKGYFNSVRWLTFLLTISLQVMASITHGRAAGFEYILYVIAVLPMLFFHEPRFYVPIFLISIASLIVVQYTYTIMQPIIAINGNGLFYWNVFFTGAVIFGIMYIFKNGYERSREALQQKNAEILLQKEEIEGINNNLEQLVEERSRKIQDHEHRFTEYAFINAHKVRGPFARIRGLLHLIELETDKGKALQEHLPSLKANTEELNEILKEVSNTLNDLPAATAATSAKAATSSGKAASAS